MDKLVTVSDSLKVWSWDEDSNKLELKGTYRPPFGPLNCAAWNHSNQVIATGGKEPKLHLIQASNAQLLNSLQLSESRLSQWKVSAVAFSNNSRYIATSLDTPIQFWDLKKRQVISIFTGHKKPIVALNFNASHDVYGGDMNGDIHLWSVKSPNAPVQSFRDSFSESLFPLTCMQLSLNGQYLAAGFENGGMKIWETNSQSGEVFRAFTGHSGKVTAMSWSPKNARLIATVSVDAKLHLVDVNSAVGGKGICAEVNVEQRCSAVSFHENGVHTAVGTMDGQVLIYDWRNTRQPLVVMNCHDPFPIQSMAFQVPNLKAESSTRTTPSTLSTSQATPESSEGATSNASLSMTSPKGVNKPAAKSLTRDEVAQSVNLSTGRQEVLESPQPSISGRDDLPHRRQLFPTQSILHNNNSLDSSQQPQSTFTDSFENHEMIEKKINAMIDNFEQNYSAQENHNNNSSSSNGSSKSAAPTQSALPPTLPPAMKATNTKPISSSSYSTSTAMRQPLPPTAVSSDEERYSTDNIAAEPTNSFQNNTNRSFPSSSLSTNPTFISPIKPVSSSAMITMPASSLPVEDEEFSDLKQAVRPVTKVELDEALELLRYDIHREVQDIIKEQVRQFSIAREETAHLFKELSDQLKDLIEANKELRQENEYLRKIY